VPSAVYMWLISQNRMGRSVNDHLRVILRVMSRVTVNNEQERENQTENDEEWEKRKTKEVDNAVTEILRESEGFVKTKGAEINNRGYIDAFASKDDTEFKWIFYVMENDGFNVVIYMDDERIKSEEGKDLKKMIRETLKFSLSAKTIEEKIDSIFKSFQTARGTEYSYNKILKPKFSEWGGILECYAVVSFQSGAGYKISIKTKDLKYFSINADQAKYEIKNTDNLQANIESAIKKCQECETRYLKKHPNKSW
jgi:hypothetical protein